MLIPNRAGEYCLDDEKVYRYKAFVDTFHRVIELLTMYDGTQYVFENDWRNMNDIEKYVCRQRGWDLDRFFEDEE